jgi:glycerate dehydrogenase
MLFYLLEQLKYYDEFVKSSSWSRGKIFTNLDRKFYEIRGKKWGIIGLGTIGQEVANVALAFGAKVSYYSTTGKNSNNRFERLELEELLKSSDIISIHAPLNETTKNLIGENELKLIKDRAVLLNLGRGGIVDERALAKEIDRRDIFIGLDVTEKEPLDENSPLLRVKNSDNLLITPHIAWASREARERLIEGIAKNIEEFIKKDRV